MADSPPTTTGGRIATSVGTLGIIATALAALTLTAVLIGNLLLLVFKVHTALWLAIVVDVGPVAGIFLSNIGNGVNYYGAWRVLRGQDKYDVKSDTKNQLQNVPGMLQWAPQALLGCFPLLSAGLLAASLIISVLTLAPAPVHALGTALQSPDTSSQGAGNSAGGGSGGSQGNTNGPSNIHFALHFGTNGTATQQCDTSSSLLAPLTATLDNSGSTSSVRWELINVDTLPGTTPLGPWATASDLTGTVAAGQTDSVTLRPDAQLCSLIPQQGNTYRVVLQAVGVGVFTLADQVGAPPHLALSLSSTTLSQTCPSFYSALPGVSVTLDNSASNVAANWQLSGMQKIPGTSHDWASPSASSGSVAAEQQATLTLTPDPKLCYWSPLPSKVYHVTLSWNSGQSVTITDHIISPPLPQVTPPPPLPNPTPSPSPPTSATWLGVTPLNTTQACTNGNLAPYPVTLVNSGSFAINWTFSATQSASATNSAVWATASPSSGSVPAGSTAQFSVTPNVGICAVAGNPSYAATLTQSGNGQQGPAQTLTDEIGVATFASFTLTPNPQSQTCGDGIAPYTVTLDNTKSNVPIMWNLSNVENAPDAEPWATVVPTLGGAQTLGAGQSQQLTVTLDQSVCLSGGTTTYTATISATSPDGTVSYGSEVLKDAVSVGTVAAMGLDSASTSQSCSGPSIGSYQVTIKNTGNVALSWVYAATEQVGGSAWSSSAPSSGSLSRGASQTLTITPVAGVCSTGGMTSTYHATIGPNGGPTFTALSLSDTITVPASVSFTLSPNPEQQTCGDGIGSYTLTIDNTKSNVPIKWSLSNIDSAPDENPWATITPSGGETQTVGAGKTQQLTVTPDQSVCSVVGTTTYHATITATSPNGATNYGSEVLQDIITVVPD